MKNKFMERAIELVQLNMRQGKGGPFGAVVVKNSQIIGEGWNKVTSNNDPTAHAEVEAIRNAAAKLNNFQLTGCEIYTSCEPCPMCLAAIYWARIDKIYYGNTKTDAAQINFDDDFLYQELVKSKEQKKIPCEQLLHDEALDVFKEWQTKTDKILY
jgi:tRNA(Arg) A34 adenosine deaminase TadA